MSDLLPGLDVVTDRTCWRACRTTRPSGRRSAGRPRRCARAPRPRCGTPSAPAPTAACRSSPRGAGTGLSGGANAVDGCLVLDLSRMNRILEIDADNLICVVAARRRQRRPQGGRRRARPLVPAGPGERALVDHRRQRRHQRRRAVLPEVRRHPRLRARAARPSSAARPAYGTVGAARPPDHQGRRGLRPGRPDGRLRGHARRGHRGDAAAAAGAGRARRAPSSAPSTASSTPARRSPRCTRRGPASRPRWSCSTAPACEAVEEWKHLGLEADAEALLLAQVDTPGEAGDAEAARWSTRFDGGRRAVGRAVDRRRRGGGAVRGAPARLPGAGAARPGAHRGRLRAALGGAGHAGRDRGDRRPARRPDRHHRARRRRQPAPADPHPARRRRGPRARRRPRSRRCSTRPSRSAARSPASTASACSRRGGMRREMSPAVLAMQRAVKRPLDPLNLFNPGKVIGDP